MTLHDRSCIYIYIYIHNTYVYIYPFDHIFFKVPFLEIQILKQKKYHVCNGWLSR